MPTTFLRNRSPSHHPSSSGRRLLNKLSASEALSKELVARAFLKPPKLTDSDSGLFEVGEKFSQSHSTWKTAPTVLETKFFDSKASISIANGLSIPTRRVSHSPRRSPRKTITSSPSKRSKSRFGKCTQLSDSCPAFSNIPTDPTPLDHLGDNQGSDEDCPPERDSALGRETLKQIESYKDFFQQCRPSRRKVKFETVEDKQPSLSSHIEKLTVADLQLQTCLKTSLRRQFEIIGELERGIRSSRRQLDRFEEMIAYEEEIAQELENCNQAFRRKLVAYQGSMPSKKDLIEDIKEVERRLEQKAVHV